MDQVWHFNVLEYYTAVKINVALSININAFQKQGNKEVMNEYVQYGIIHVNSRKHK